MSAVELLHGTNLAAPTTNKHFAEPLWASTGPVQQRAVCAYCPAVDEQAGDPLRSALLTFRQRGNFSAVICSGKKKEHLSVGKSVLTFTDLLPYPGATA